MTLFMLDTNMVSHLIRQHPNVLARLKGASVDDISISSITAGELFYGLAKRPGAKRLHQAIEEFLKCVEVLSWDQRIAQCYGSLRSDVELAGKPLAPLDLLIAAHALSSQQILVTNDGAFKQVPLLTVEDWTI